MQFDRNSTVDPSVDEIVMDCLPPRKAGFSGSDAVRDLAETVGYWHLWLNLGTRDIRARYRRTVIGPFWTILSGAILIVSLGLLYSLLWHIEVSTFLPYFSAGYISWIFVSSNISESCSALIGGEAIIKSLKLPYNIHIARVLWRNLLVFGHGLVVHAAVLIFFKLWPTEKTLLLPLGLLLVMFNLFWMGIIVAVLCARFRDVVQLVASVIQIFFFITPIFWPVERLADHPGAKFVLADLNVVYHLVDVVRQPLLGQAPDGRSYLFLIVVGVVGWAVTLWFFARFRRRIAYWL